MKLAGYSLVFALMVRSALAADLQGADAFLKYVTKAQEAGPDQPISRKNLRSAISSYESDRDSLSPVESARRWIALLDPLLTSSGGDSWDPSDQPISLSDVLDALPAPEVWKEIARQLDAKESSTNADKTSKLLAQMLGHVLINDKTGLGKDALQLLDESSAENINALTLAQRTASFLGDPDLIEKCFARNVELWSQNSYFPFQISNLIEIFGAEKAKAMLKQALLTAKEGRRIEFDDPATKKLARAVALENLAELPSAPWDLVDSLDDASVVLFEGLKKRFSDMVAEAEPARNCYFFNLIVKGKTKAAIEFFDSVKKAGRNERSDWSRRIGELSQYGYMVQVRDFYHDYLQAHPNAPFWNDYIEVATQTGDSERMLKLLAGAEASRLDEQTAATLQSAHYAAFLATGHLDDGMKLFKAALEKAKAQSGTTSRRWQDEQPMREALRYATIGWLTGHEEWQKEGEAMATEIAQHSTNGASYDSPPRLLAPYFLIIGDDVRAEKVLFEDVANAKPQSASDGMNNDLATLIAIYDRAGRYQDVLALLDRAPQWNVKDLADGIGSLSLDSVPVALGAARALWKTGSPEKAEKILEALLRIQSGYDPAYELLLEIKGDTALSFLDELAAEDRFEERPLIWKAELLFRDKKLEEAEKVVREAITIDPSDGEEPRGDRMRAYAVLAKVRKARGDEKEAAFYDGVVKAIRISEDADRFAEAGLISQAVARYENALGSFSDAYCIQSRLALRLAEEGKEDEAASHFQRAYELMPDSFGRVESHCFGCEGAFRGPFAQSIAEKVFTALARSKPDKPQVPYLMGYLRMEQERYAEAFKYFRKATGFDPDYLNAWKKMAEIADHAKVSPADANQMVLAILRLDPCGHHGRPDAGNADDLATIWQAVKNASTKCPALPKELYPLKASAAQLNSSSASADSTHNPNQDDAGASIGDILASQSVLHGISDMLR